MLDDDAKKYLEGVVGWVEAISFEQHCLWKENHLDSNMPWIENRMGLGRTVGHIGEHVVFVSLRTAIVDGHKLLFITPTSVVVDHDKVRDWLERALPPEVFAVRSDAQNFHNVLHAVRRLAA